MSLTFRRNIIYICSEMSLWWKKKGFWRVQCTFQSSPWWFILKLINNSWSLNKGNHDRDGVWISDLNWHGFLRFYFSVFSLVLVSIEKIYQTLETVFHQLSKHLEFRQKYSATRRIFNSLLGVWISDETLFLVFDILLDYCRHHCTSLDQRASKEVARVT